MKVLRVFLSIIAFFLSIALFAAVLVTIIQSSLFNSVKPEKITSMLAEVSAEKLVPDLTVIQDSLPEEYRDIAESEELNDAVTEVVGSFAADYLDHLLQGEGEFELDREKLDGIFYEAIDQYAQSNEVEISTEDVESIKQEYSAAVDEAVELLPKVDELVSSEVSSVPGESGDDLSGFTNALSVIRKIVSSELTLILLIAVAVICLLIALCKLSFFRWLAPCGIPTLLAGGLVFGVSMVAGNLLDRVVADISSEESVRHIVESLFTAVIDALRTSGLIALIIGAVAIVAHIVLACVFGRKKEEKQTA
ncbi:MAG: hypothetical protein IKM04_03235 [Clostridia bacterium]|nr:hypothetical protein [Clostridia bacterium]